MVEPALKKIFPTLVFHFENGSVIRLVGTSTVGPVMMMVVEQLGQYTDDRNGGVSVQRFDLASLQELVRIDVER